VSSTTAIIAGTISANSVQAAPVALAKSVTAVAIAKGAAASGSTLTLIKGALKIMAWTKTQTVIVASVCVLLATGTTIVAVKHAHANNPTPQVGTWNAATGESVVFNKDGSFSVRNLPLDKKLRDVSELDGTWKMIDANHLNVEISTPRGKYSTIYLFSVVGDELSIQQSGVQGIKTYQRFHAAALPNINDLGAVELVAGIPRHFSLGMGKSCILTGKQLSDGIDISAVILTTNADGTVQRSQGEISTSAGRQCAIGIGNTKIGLTPTLKTP
jgi:hypothetical protein